MGYSEKTAREIEKYIRKLVKCMPKWLQHKFHTEQIVFIIEDDGSLSVQCTENVSKQLREKAGDKIYAYMAKNTCPAIKVLEVQ